MFLSFKLVLLAVICSSFLAIAQITGAYTVLTPQQIRDPDVQASLQIGVPFVVNNLIENDVIPDGTYKFILNRAEEQIVAGVNYRFTGVLKSKCKKVRQPVVFVVFQDLEGNREVEAIDAPNV